MPLHTVKSKHARFNDADFNRSNTLAALMHISCDPKEESEPAKGKTGFGWAPPYWDLAVGSVLFRRQDMKPLNVDTLEAFAAFCQRIRFVIFRTVKGHDMPGPSLTPAQALAEVTKEKWIAFLVTWKKDKIALVNELHEESAEQADDLIESFRGMKLERDDAEPWRISAVATNEDSSKKTNVAGGENGGSKKSSASTTQ